MEASAVASSSSLKSDEKETEHGRQDELKSSLRDADEEYSRKRQRIEEEIQNEQHKLLASLEEKKLNLLKLAKQELEETKASILSVLPSTSSIKCSLCSATMTIGAAQCISPDCKASFCKSCTQNKIEDNVKCHCCTDVINVMCPSCLEERNKKGWYQFDYCREDCGFICPEHTRHEYCCVCGDCNLCSSAEGVCELSECGRCGEKLCDRCEYKEGCMCR